VISTLATPATSCPGCWLGWLPRIVFGCQVLGFAGSTVFGAFATKVSGGFVETRHIRLADDQKENKGDSDLTAPLAGGERHVDRVSLWSSGRFPRQKSAVLL